MDLQFKQSRDIVNWLGEEEVEDINDESSGEEDCVLESDHETDTEQEGDSDEDNVPLCQREVYKGKDGTQWNKAVPPKNKELLLVGVKFVQERKIGRREHLAIIVES
ncbi:hypothetical protein C0J52_05392 [Blattella germanica]|nr:hypothetical protein C0J52_05392 [Blattella germanica]